MPPLSEESVLKIALVGVILASLAIHFLTFGFGYTFVDPEPLIYPPLHSVLETLGALIALVVGYLLIVLEERDEGASYNIRIAAAFIGMGLLDLVHGSTESGRLFVWFHSSSVLAGGLLSATVWLPDRWFRRRTLPWVLGILTLSVVFILLSFVFDPSLPLMIHGDQFTMTALAMNLLGGVLLLSAALYMFRTYQFRGRMDDFVFCAHYSLIGASALTFSQSSLWDMNWWSWHLLRVMGYAVAMIFAFRSHLMDHLTLLRRKDDLEEQVRERTQQLEDSLKEKELLLEEVHHRVKNNLQIINSLLNLQSRQTEQECQDPFEESKNRIRSIALVHEYLYESESLQDLNFKEYSEGLIDQLVSSLLSDDFDLSLRREIDEIRLNLDETVQCGLILNEALTNCFQHAFVDREQGRVRIRFVTAGERYVLTIEDDGVGLPESDPDELSDTLGLDLIRTLVEIDLDGSLTIDSGPDGTTLTVAFPVGED